MSSGEFDPLMSNRLREASSWLRGVNMELLEGWDAEAVPTLDLTLENQAMFPADNPVSRPIACQLAEDTLYYLYAKLGDRPADKQQQETATGVYRTWAFTRISVEHDIKRVYVTEWRPFVPPQDGLHVSAWAQTERPPGFMETRDALITKPVSEGVARRLGRLLKRKLSR